MLGSCGYNIKAIVVIFPALLCQPKLTRALMNFAGLCLVTCTNSEFDNFSGLVRLDLTYFVITYD